MSEVHPASPWSARRWRRGPGLVGLAMATVLVLGGCGIAAHNAPPSAAASATPLPTVSPAVNQTRLQIEGALAAAQFVLTTAAQPFRPPESPMLAAAPRAVFQVNLLADPDHGYIVVYEFPTAEAAAAAGHEMAAYLGTGPGRIQFVPDTQPTLRQLGTTLIFYAWSPANSPGQDGGKIAAALQTVGQGFAIPR